MSRSQSLLLIPLIALASCPTTVNGGSLEIPTVELAAIIGQDTRITYEQYAALHQMSVQAVYDKFLANGRLYCGRRMSTANVTMEKDIIIGAAHAFYTEDCTPKFKDISDCKFYAITGPGLLSEPYELAGMPTVGTKCPRDFDDSNDGWFVARLKKNVANVRPYQLHPNCEMRPDLNGSYIAASNDNFGDKDNPPPNIGVCKIDVPDVFAPDTYRSNCSAGRGGSGGAFACDTREGLFIAGVAVWSVLDYKTADFTKYGPANYTRMIPLTGKFLETLLAVAKYQKR